MSVQFEFGVSTIKWSAPTAALGLTSKTICFQVYPDSLSTSNGWFVIWDGTGTDTDEYNLIFTNSATATKLSFLAHFSTTNGVWTTTNSVLTAGAWNKIAIVYNGGATTNDPVIYINGTSVAVTENTTPAGTYRSGTSNNFLSIGAVAGKIKDCRIYSGTKTSAQIALIAADDIDTIDTIDTENLVFFNALSMCKGLTYATFGGSVLGTANEFLGSFDGYVGVPQSSPVGA